MKELSIFIDESGDFGKYSHHSPFYIVAMIFHEQNHSIKKLITKLDYELSMLGFKEHCIHSGPIIRQEQDYSFVTIETRRKIFNKMVAFFKQLNVQYKCFYIEKRHITNVMEASEKLSKLISIFIQEHYQLFLDYEIIKIYYDNGQMELSKIISSVFHTLLPNVEFRKVIPSHYRLFQVADLICTFELLRLKLENHTLSKKFL